MDSITSNTDKIKTVKPSPGKVTQKVQHQEKQQEKLLDSVRESIKEIDPPQRIKKINVEKNHQTTQEETNDPKTNNEGRKL